MGAGGIREILRGASAIAGGRAAGGGGGMGGGVGGDVQERVARVGRGRVLANLFLEDSTRTRASFSSAAMAIGMSVVDLASQGSSVGKGETLIDTARTLEAAGAGVVVVRAKPSGAAALVAGHVGVPVINAGDGRHEHPTQGLLDVFALATALGRDDFDLGGVRVAIVGDVVNSRVARSDIAAMTALGAEVVVVGPGAFVPEGLASLGCAVERDLDGVIGEVDAVQVLRVQFERHGGRSLVSVASYREGYAMTAERASRLRAGAFVMHPGPMNRGLEIDGAVADGERSLVRRQVEAGVWVRMSVLCRCLGVCW